MNAAEIGAAATVAAVVVTVLLALAGLVYNAGRHSQRLTKAEEEIGGLKTAHEEMRDKQAEHSVAIAIFARLEQAVDEIRKDVKLLMGGRRRRPEAEG